MTSHPKHTRERSEGAHTPGPWSDGREVLIRGCHRVGLNIAFVNTSDAKKGAEAEANARLIAAAPDLLAAAQALDDFWIESGFSPPGEADEPRLLTVETLAVWRKIRSAIASALGEGEGR